jgi:hypothetical protein
MLADDLVPVSEEMLDRLYTETSARIEPVLQALITCVRQAQLVNLDDTPVLVLDPKRPNRRRTGHMWVAVGDQRYCWFFSTPSWRSEEAETRLGTLTGTLQGDGYTAFRKMAKKLGIRLAGCMAHLRRKLRKAMLAKDPRATEAIALIQGLYRIERLARLQGLDANALVALRRARAVPLMAALERWAHTVAPSVETGSPLGKAWTYLNNQWDCLQTYLSNPAVNIDNNAAERALRRITIGRKLWLFFRGNVTFERAARIASLLATARLHGADERRYLEWLLRELARREWSPEAAARLLPEAWLASQEKKAEEGGSVEMYGARVYALPSPAARVRVAGVQPELTSVGAGQLSDPSGTARAGPGHHQCRRAGGKIFYTTRLQRVATQSNTAIHARFKCSANGTPSLFLIFA